MGRDYELENAQEWDLDRRPNSSALPVRQTLPARLSWKESAHKRAQKFPQKHLQEDTQAQKSDASWTLVEGAARSLKPLTGHKVPPKLIEDVDNEGEAAARKDELPKDSISVPVELLGSNERTLEQIAFRNGTFITPASSSSDRFIMEIYGEGNAVARTKQAIYDWISSEKPSKHQLGTHKFAKQLSFTPKLGKLAEKRWKREVKRHMYRKHPVPGTEFGAIGSFLWPMQECNPLEVLGPHLEALDPIRMDHSCYIVWYKEQSIFKVFGDKPKDVRDSLVRIRKVFFQVAAYQVTRVHSCLLWWSDDMCLPTHIRLEPYEFPAIMIPANAPFQLPGQTPRGDGVEVIGSRVQAAMVSTASNASKIRDGILKVLRKVHYYQGHIQLRIRLGVFLATQVRQVEDNLYTLSDFENMISQSQFEGHVSPEIGDMEVEKKALSAIQGASDFLLPRDAMTEHLHEIKPVYAMSATFAEGGSELQLIMEWQEGFESHVRELSFELTSKRWIRLNEDGSQTGLVDISLIDVQKATAWQFDLLASRKFDEIRLPPELVAFADGARIDPVAIREKKPFVITPLSSRLKSMQQRVIWRYDIIKSDYSLELTRFQRRCGPNIYEPRWAVSVYRTAWDTMLVENELLRIGQRADWDDDVETWFPKDLGSDDEEDGFAQLMKKLEKIAKIIKVPVKDSVGGMMVG